MVRVESGLAQGIWLRLNLDVEGEYWIDTYEARVQNFPKSLCTSRVHLLRHRSEPGILLLRRCEPDWVEREGIQEPEPENGLRFREITVRNNLQDQVELVEAAVWSYTSSSGIPFRRGGRHRTYGGVLADGAAPVLAQGETRLVSTISLDDFIRGGHPAPDVLKVDLEGESVRF